MLNTDNTTSSVPLEQLLPLKYTCTHIVMYLYFYFSPHIAIHAVSTFPCRSPPRPAVPQVPAPRGSEAGSDPRAARQLLLLCSGFSQGIKK